MGMPKVTLRLVSEEEEIIESAEARGSGLMMGDCREKILK